MLYSNVTYDVVVVLGSFKKDLDGVFPQVLKGEFLGGQTRMQAASVLYDLNPLTEFYVVGGYDSRSGSSNEVRDMVSFLKDSCSEIVLIEISSLPCTHHNLIALLNTWRNDTVRLNRLRKSRIGLLTNYYHLPRSTKLISDLLCGCFSDLKIPLVIPICAEAYIDESPMDNMFSEPEMLLARLDTEIEALRSMARDKIVDGCLDESLPEFLEIIRAKPHTLLAPEERERMGL